MAITGKKYSLTLRRLIQLYTENSAPEDMELSLNDRIKVIARRIADAG